MAKLTQLEIDVLDSVHVKPMYRGSTHDVTSHVLWTFHVKANDGEHYKWDDDVLAWDANNAALKAAIEAYLLDTEKVVPPVEAAEEGDSPAGTTGVQVQNIA